MVNRKNISCRYSTENSNPNLDRICILREPLSRGKGKKFSVKSNIKSEEERRRDKRKKNMMMTKDIFQKKFSNCGGERNF